MSIIAHALAAFSALWIDYGWQPLSGGGNEYIIQVPPELVDTLHSEGIESYVPPAVEDIRRIRITVGRQTLPQTAAKPSEPASPANAKSSPADPQDQKVSAAPAAGESQERIAKYPDESSRQVAGDDRAPSAAARDAEPAISFFGLDALTLAGIGLGIAAALVVFLAWANLSMRARYRALLLRQRHEL